jgi:hypothetical protein
VSHAGVERMTRLAVNEALIERMPLGALVRQLGRLMALGPLQPFAPAADRVVEALSSRSTCRLRWRAVGRRGALTPSEVAAAIRA